MVSRGACEYVNESMNFIDSVNSVSQKTWLNEMAEAIDSPIAFTAKTPQQPKRSGLLISTTCAIGGFRIEKDKSITIKESVIGIDGDCFFTNCLLGLNIYTSSHLWSAHEICTGIMKNIIKYLFNLSIR